MSGRLVGTVTWTILLVLAVVPQSPAQAPVDPFALWEQATVYRDEWGVPHVYAASPRAMAFAFGYAQAEDHLESMLLAYRYAQGRVAEVMGEAYAPNDEFALKMGHHVLATASYPQADPVTRELCEGFALGVNAYLINHPDRAPAWAEAVNPEDILALMHAYLMSFAPFDLPDVFSPPPGARSGNAWAIAPSKSATGEAMLVINPHADYDGPFQWYEAHLAVGDYDMQGATLQGIPVIMMGHNGTLGWALTPNRPDFADMYMEPKQQGTARNPASVGGPVLPFDPKEVRYLEMVANARTFYVMTPGGPVERQVPTLISDMGPIVGRFDNRFCAYFIGGYRDFGAVRQLFTMGTARTLAAFQQTLELHQLPCFNVVYADSEGNIFYLYNAKVGEKYIPGSRPIIDPSMRDGVNWSLPVSAGNSLLRWGNIVPPNLLPNISNPASGYVQACGNPPWGVTEKSGLMPDQWPAWFAQDPDSHRAKRVRQLLGMGKRSFQDAQAMLYDVLVPIAVTTVPKLLEAVDANPAWLTAAHPDLPIGLDALRNWKYVAETNSPGMTFFHVWWSALRARAPGYSEDAVVAMLEQNAPEAQESAFRAAEQAARLMRSEFNSLTVPWGDVHIFARGDTSVPAPGSLSGNPVFIASDTKFVDGRWRVNYGYGFAMAVKFGEAVEAVSMVPFGSSTDPRSKHHTDQMQLVSNRTFKPVRFYPDDVKRNAAVAFGRNISLFPPGMEAECRISAREPVTARVESYTQPPAPIPLGLATFAMYVRVDQRPASVPSTIELDVYLPPEVCADENLSKLLVYAYDSQQGWGPLEAQELAFEERIFRARDRRPRVYAVLGPQELRGSLPTMSTEMIAQAQSAAATGDAATSDVEVTGEPVVQDSAPQPVVPMPDDKAATPEPSQEPETEDASESTADQSPVEERKSAIAWGSRLELAPPGVDGLLSVKSDKSIGARLIVSPDPPAQIPANLAAFTDYVLLEFSPPDAAVEINLWLRPEEGSVGRGFLDKLTVYTYEPAQGWTPMADAAMDAEKQVLTGSDSKPRTYAILGPKEYRLQQGVAVPNAGNE
ncbi:MAG: hypothetical protein AMXMBFR84_24060 [Candidatus Hydrogenedentota bacterium]